MALGWLWGGNAANQNPLGLGIFVYNLRYPGQYSQAETGLSYNYFRDYDGVTARYIESDPVGLKGGINTYAYARENLISNVDPFGLWTVNLGINIGFQIGYASFTVSGGSVVDGVGNIGTYGTG